jgi:hypothetical protein
MPGETACQREPGIALALPSENATSRDSDGFLDASEVAALQISANLVVLSACNTATGGNATVQKGDSLAGLAESFFIAGARSLLVTHWQVPSAVQLGETGRFPLIRHYSVRNCWLSVMTTLRIPFSGALFRSSAAEKKRLILKHRVRDPRRSPRIRRTLGRCSGGGPIAGGC